MSQGEKKIRRLFGDVEELRRYLRGRWKGRGIHGDPLAREKVLDVRLWSDRGIWRARIEPVRESILERIRSRRSRADIPWEKPMADREDFEIRPDKVSVDPDMARFPGVVIQGMDDSRAHLTLQDTAGRLRFSGTIHRRRWWEFT